MMNTHEATEFQQLLYDHAFVRSAQVQLTPLTGGVSSAIFWPEDGDRRFSVKRALEQLKVEADWFAAA